MKVADFFCGAGGFSEGFRQAGFKTIFAVDKWTPAVNTHHGNHPKSKTIQDDVERLSLLPDDEFHSIIPDTEIIIGSPPCVAFSNSNKSGKGDKSLGISLLESYLRIVARKKYKNNSILKYWILENVPNIQNYIKPEYSSDDLGIGGDFTLKVISEHSGVYNSKYFGVAQNRKRFFCGDFPNPQQIITNDEDVVLLRTVLDSLGEPKENLEIIVKDPNYNFQMISKNITDHHFIKELIEYEWKRAKQLKEDKGYMGKMAFPEDINKPARTVMANSSVSSRESTIYRYKNARFRMPTVRELASIMSFPIDYRFYGTSLGIKSKLVGNAVPPRVSYAFAKSIAEQQGLKVSTDYSPIKHSTHIKFTNLNNTIFPLNKEKQKKDSARFKYHIPYLKIHAFRVELTNYHSDFKNKKYQWDVEIHKGQGPSARIYKPNIDVTAFNAEIVQKIELFMDDIDNKLVNFNAFQHFFCLTTDDRKGVMGPNELLVCIKGLIVNIVKDDVLAESINIDEEPQLLPNAIAVGYVVLKKIIDRMRGLVNE